MVAMALPARAIPDPVVVVADPEPVPDPPQESEAPEPLASEPVEAADPNRRTEREAPRETGA